MSRESTTYLLSSLGSQLPALLVLALAAVLALLFLRRAVLPSLLTMAGAVTMAGAKIGVTLFQSSLIEGRETGGRDMEEFGRLMAGIGITGACVQAIGLALLVAAIFVGRGKTARVGT